MLDCDRGRGTPSGAKVGAKSLVWNPPRCYGLGPVLDVPEHGAVTVDSLPMKPRQKLGEWPAGFPRPLPWVLLMGWSAALATAIPAETIRNTTRGTAHGRLEEALKASREGDVLELSGGPHVGNFAVSHGLTLRGVDGVPVLDGGGKGTVLDIRADGVTIENLECRNSGRSGSAFELWGDAGIAVHGDRATLTKVRVSGNDWGVLFFDGEGSVLQGSEVSDNENDGVRIMGGRDHRITGCTVNRNGTGISIDAGYPDRQAPILSFGDPSAVKDFVEKKAKTLLSHGNVVKDNEVLGNAFYGIVVTWESHHNEIDGNRVSRTGKERPIDKTRIAAWEKALGGASGIAVSFDHEPYGSGILLACLATENTVSRNEVDDNTAHGIVLNLVTKNAITANRVRSNRIGLFVISADENRLSRNRVTGHAEFGIRIGSDDLFKQASAGNLVMENFLAENAVNAHDSSGRKLTAADLEGRIDRLPLPRELKRQMARSPAMRAQMLGAYLANLTPGTNRWDDGTSGNYHDDFDTREEGFVDRDGNAISEAGKPIPGGPSIDHHPLSAALVERLLGKTVP